MLESIPEAFESPQKVVEEGLNMVDLDVQSADSITPRNNIIGGDVCKSSRRFGQKG